MASDSAAGRLAAAAEAGDVAGVRRLLSGGCNPDDRDAKGTGLTGLHYAASRGDVDVVRRLRCPAAALAHVQWHRARGCGWRYQRVCVCVRGRAQVEALVVAGANTNLSDAHAKTPLNRAAEYGKRDVVVRLAQVADCCTKVRVCLCARMRLWPCCVVLPVDRPSRGRSSEHGILTDVCTHVCAACLWRVLCVWAGQAWANAASLVRRRAALPETCTSHGPTHRRCSSCTGVRLTPACCGCGCCIVQGGAAQRREDGHGATVVGYASRDPTWWQLTLAVAGLASNRVTDRCTHAHSHHRV